MARKHSFQFSPMTDIRFPNQILNGKQPPLFYLAQAQPNHSIKTTVLLEELNFNFLWTPTRVQHKHNFSTRLYLLEGNASNSHTTILVSLNLKIPQATTEAVKPIYTLFLVFTNDRHKKTIDNFHGLKYIKHVIKQHLCGLQFTFRRAKP